MICWWVVNDLSITMIPQTNTILGPSLGWNIFANIICILFQFSLYDMMLIELNLLNNVANVLFKSSKCDKMNDVIKWEVNNKRYNIALVIIWAPCLLTSYITATRWVNTAQTVWYSNCYFRYTTYCILYSLRQRYCRKGTVGKPEMFASSEPKWNFSLPNRTICYASAGYSISKVCRYSTDYWETNQ